MRIVLVIGAAAFVMLLAVVQIRPRIPFTDEPQIFASYSPDGHTALILLRRLVFPVFDADVRVLAQRDGRSTSLEQLENDACSVPSKVKVFWAPDSSKAALFVCDGLCGSVRTRLYDAKTNKLSRAEDTELEAVIARKRTDTPTTLPTSPLAWACSEIDVGNQ